MTPPSILVETLNVEYAFNMHAVNIDEQSIIKFQV